MSNVDEPLIQIVDDQDRIIDQASIQEVHKKGLRHRVARVMVFDASGQVLLQKRSAHIDTFPNCWDNSAAGHVDVGETYEEAAKRELFEEVGLRADLTCLGNYASTEQAGNIALYRYTSAYKAELPDARKVMRHPEEVSETVWMTLSEVKSLIQTNPGSCTPGLRDVVTKYFS